MSMAVAHEYPHADVVGIELALPFYWISCLRRFLWKRKNMSVVWQDAVSMTIVM